MDYRELWQRLTTVYDEGEAQAVVRYLLDLRFGLSLSDIYCGKLATLTATARQELEQAMRRLEQAEPVQYVVGVAEFCGRQFRVAPGVLIPRPETEELCRWITAGGDVLDIGTGSGCIAITLAAEMPDAKVTAWDISEEALSIARENARRNHVQTTFVRQDALNPPADSARWDVIVSNPPYIDEAAERDGMAKNVLAYEPHTALFAPKGTPDLFYRRIGAYAIGSLRPGGQLFFELNPLTAVAVADHLSHLGFQDIVVRKDQQGRQRMLKATKP